MNSKKKWITSIALILISSIYYISAQEIKKDDLIKMWDLNSYKIGDKEYPPTNKEKDDYIHFKEDMTFDSMSEKKKESGTWMLNINGGYIIMVDDKGEKTKVYITTLTTNKLVLRFDIEEIRDIEIQYSSIR